MDSDTMKLFAGTVLRHAATVIAGYLVAKGVTNADQTSQIVGAIMTIGAIAWSAWQKYGHAKVAAELDKLQSVPQTATIPKPPTATVTILLAIGLSLFFQSYGQAQAPHRPALTGDLVKDIRSDLEGGKTSVTGSVPPAVQNILQQIYDKLHAQGQEIIADMQKANALAAQTFSDGTIADGPSNQCLTAFIPVAQLIVNNQIAPEGVTPATPLPSTPAATQPTPQTPDGLVTVFVKIRIVVNALNSPSIQKGCAWLKSDLQQVGVQGTANVIGGLMGLTKLGVL